MDKLSCYMIDVIVLGEECACHRVGVSVFYDDEGYSNDVISRLFLYHVIHS